MIRCVELKMKGMIFMARIMSEQTMHTLGSIIYREMRMNVKK